MQDKDLQAAARAVHFELCGGKFAQASQVSRRVAYEIAAAVLSASVRTNRRDAHAKAAWRAAGGDDWADAGIDQRNVARHVADAALAAVGRRPPDATP